MKAIQFNTANVVKSAIKCMGFEMDEAINIVFICDDGYALPTTVAITSIIHNKNNDTAININIIGRSLNKTNREIIDQIKAKNVIVNYIDVQDTLNLSVNNTHFLYIFSQLEQENQHPLPNNFRKPTLKEYRKVPQ